MVVFSSFVPSNIVSFTFCTQVSGDPGAQVMYSSGSFFFKTSPEAAVEALKAGSFYSGSSLSYLAPI